MRIDRIQDDGGRFILQGEAGMCEELQRIFSDVGLGISVTESDRGTAYVLYTENNRDIVLRMLRDCTDD
ncbi:MAG: hypothetical protein ABEJ36_00700 [Candidatus Nanosalina sp.]